MKAQSYGRVVNLGLSPELVSALESKYGEVAKNIGREVFYRSLVALYLEKGMDNIEEGLASPLVQPGKRSMLAKVFVTHHARAEIERRFRMEVPFPKQVRIILAAFATAKEAPPLNAGMRSRWNAPPAEVVTETV